MTTWNLQRKGLYGLSALCMALALQACGGGGGSSSASSSGDTSSTTSGTQLSSGVVTGFGSVFVDGKELEDANASVVTENADGSYSNTVLQMGQRVRVNHDGNGTASKVTVDAAVIGTIASIDTTANTLTVAGQKVTVVTTSSAGSLTVWGGGYSSISDAVVGDLAEVHGTPVYDSTAKAYTVTASRIQKLTTATGGVQVAGTISSLDTTAKTFAINGLTVNYQAASLRPSSATLANGTVVTAYGPLSALSGTTLTASNVKVNRLQDSTLSVSSVQVGGQVSKYSSTDKTFEVQGYKVSIGSGTTINPNGKTVADGAWVTVSATVGTDGSLTATNIQIRQQNTGTDLATVKLMGVISDFVDNASFVVRGVPVDASGINVATACPGVTLANDVAVQVTATQQANTSVVLATKLVCKVQGAVVIRPVDGTVSAVDATAKTFTLSLTGSTTSQSVQWNDNTTFVGVTTATLASAKVRVEGYLSGSTLVARTVSLSNGTGKLDDAAFRSTSDSASSSWSKYRNSHRH